MIPLLVWAILPNLVVCSIIPEERNERDEVDTRCNQEISLQRNVELFGECRASSNCKVLGERAQCIYKRDNYCVCEIVDGMEERKPKKLWKKNLCKEKDGFKCLPKKDCKKKHFRRSEYHCIHKNNFCCADCKTAGYQCIDAESCPKALKKQTYRCKGSGSCCKKFGQKHGESCVHPLECIDKSQTCDMGNTFKCICEKGTAYEASIDECLPHKKYDEKCKFSPQCFEPYQECDGTCMCIDSYVYHEKTKLCYPEQVFGEQCKVDDQCTEDHQVCKGTCDCNAMSVRETVNGVCLLKKQYDESCVDSVQCVSVNQECDAGSKKCVCITDTEHDPGTNGCYDTKAYTEACEVDVQCNEGNQMCGAGFVCTCDSSSTYDTSASSCISYKSYGEDCTLAAECNMDNMECSSSTNKCDCVSPAFYDDSSLCLLAKTYGDSCVSNLQCTADNEICDGTCSCDSSTSTHSGSGVCSLYAAYGEACIVSDQCNEQNQECSGSICQCTSGGALYITDKCEPFGVYGSSCVDTAQCTESNQHCDGGTSTCKCVDSTVIYDSGTNGCYLPKSYGEACEVNKQCDLYDYGACINGSCACHTSYYDHNGVCLKYSYAGYSCVATDHCKSPETTCTGGYCRCPSGLVFVANTQSCLPSKAIHEACDGSEQCGAYQSCLEGTCKCWTPYLTADSCKPTVGIGSPCDNGIMCYTSNAICNDSFICECKPQHFLYSGSCIQYKEYYWSCWYNIQCYGQHQSCTDWRCKCNSGYVKGSECLPEVPSYGGSCLEDVQCTYDDVKIGCMNGTCDCVDTHVWDGSSECKPRKLLGEACDIQVQCSGIGQTCDTNCKCPNEDDVADYDTGDCHPPKNYSEACVVDAQCKGSFQICDNGECDCNDDTLWSGTECVQFKNTGESCVTDLHDQCLGALDGCVDGTCKCGGPAGFFNDVTSCVPAKQYGEKCELDGECKSDNQVCEDMACACDMGAMYDSGTNSCAT